MSRVGKDAKGGVSGPCMSITEGKRAQAHGKSESQCKSIVRFDRYRQVNHNQTDVLVALPGKLADITGVDRENFAWNWTLLLLFLPPFLPLSSTRLR